MKETVNMATPFKLRGEDSPPASWRLNGIGVLRIVFGLIWGVDAWFKWQPGFISGFSDYLSGAQADQPLVVHHWIGFMINVIGIDPTAFAYATAVGETAIAIALLFGVFTNLTVVAGSVLSLLIWSTAEGFGGPYSSGSTDIGAAVMYVLIFAGLFLASSGLYLGYDRRLTAALGRFGFLASGSFSRRDTRARIGKPLAT
jgi:thiosulfate dehydrogenase [quinone] large subunit